MAFSQIGDDSSFNNLISRACMLVKITLYEYVVNLVKIDSVV